MCSAIEFFISNHNDLHPGLARELYALRKKTFHERLEWKVECEDNQERDQFDNANTTYLMGMSEGQLFCGARFIDAKHPTMTDEIFYQYFNNISLPKNIPCCEITRLFLDKARRDEGNLRTLPASKALFLAMIMYCLKNGYPGMHAVTSRGMYAIFRQANWKVEVLQKGLSEKGEAVYYIFMPANEQVIEDIITKDKNSAWLRDTLTQLQHL
ncbi:acyl-homoserine-lactone synthase [Cedecea neteri]|uniref:Acyl-homoserine-lactone synthase n=2 Tax=Cedecea neteri TaxID=158822 RepID=A0A291DW49_9ENTR|nr:acyl-homoserine-lactone synthase [Cedecea neteri]ATF92024.1 acyl homoserine lactone synthase [Cedecea neteri]